ncbi:hypothetical protein LINGRAHAP2_LOCUS12648, partial [Linum grandiflorum]
MRLGGVEARETTAIGVKCKTTSDCKGKCGYRCAIPEYDKCVCLE